MNNENQRKALKNAVSNKKLVAIVLNRKGKYHFVNVMTKTIITVGFSFDKLVDAVRFYQSVTGTDYKPYGSETVANMSPEIKLGTELLNAGLDVRGVKTLSEKFSNRQIGTVEFTSFNGADVDHIFSKFLGKYNMRSLGVRKISGDVMVGHFMPL
jgi:hypothetical protein